MRIISLFAMDDEVTFCAKMRATMGTLSTVSTYIARAQKVPLLRSFSHPV